MKWRCPSSRFFSYMRLFTSILTPIVVILSLAILSHLTTTPLFSSIGPPLVPLRSLTIPGPLNPVFYLHCSFFLSPPSHSVFPLLLSSSSLAFLLYPYRILGVEMMYWERRRSREGVVGSWGRGTWDVRRENMREFLWTLLFFILHYIYDALF